MKKILFALLGLLIAIAMSSCDVLKLADDRADESAIFSFVTENENLLNECIKINDFKSLDNVKIIREIEPEQGFVEFSCGGAGFGSATSYCGFYYSENDDMTEIWCAPKSEPLIKSGSGYMWQENNGDNTYYTEQICGHFYYYEASF